MPWKQKKRDSRYNLWMKLSLASFAVTILFMIVSIVMHQIDHKDPPIHWFFLGGAAFVMFGTTGAVKEGRIFAQFTDCTRENNPIAFWTQATVAYAFGALLIGLFLIGLM